MGEKGGSVSHDEEERASVLLGHSLGKRSRHCPVSA
ncbi:NOD2 isoform 6 [Pongo abelii]|uniref:NOD2 isoform 6 n=1 Tax=Pongo abelii TaxID=9601 RepID=A0A2J8VYC4_PONAB|nr:NOD2 isoform 6 [Pongo abelii]